MNIKDIEIEKMDLPWRDSPLDTEGGMRLGDMLMTMFEGQLELVRKYHPIEEKNGTLVVAEGDFGNLDMRQVQTRLKDLAWRMTEELGEAMNCLKNRPHKSTHQTTDVEHFQEEMADVVHYLMELLLTAGIGPELLFMLYFKKHAVNEFRQRSNY